MVENEKQKIQSIEEASTCEVETRRKGILSGLALEEENVRFANSAGISINNREQGFLPAFQNIRNGCCRISRFADGRPAPIHILDGLPADWIAERESNGQVIRALPQIISGFIRNGDFYTRDEASQVILNQGDGLI